MEFQFLCPQGHILQGSPAHSGRTINCPICGVLFVIPAMQAPPDVMPASPEVPGGFTPVRLLDHGAAGTMAESEPEQGLEDSDLLDFSRRGSRLPWLSTGEEGEDPEIGAFDEEAEHSEPDSPESHDTPIRNAQRVHVYCPKGHELVTPIDTMEQEVLCPYCGEQFLLQYKNTKEYRVEKQIKEEIRERKLGQKWLIWAVVAGVGVLSMLIAMAVYSARHH